MLHSHAEASAAGASLASPNGATRRKWTTGELTEIVTQLATLRTSDIANRLGVNPKALRSALRRNGISLRALRNCALKERETESVGIVIRRPVTGPSATFGAIALVELPEKSCHWPLGDPALPSFAFCARPALRRGSYCARHRELAIHREENIEASREA